MRESLMYGSVRGARGNSRPYRDAGTREREHTLSAVAVEASAPQPAPWKPRYAARAVILLTSINKRRMSSAGFGALNR
jgi:hypothetical protein